MANSIRNRLIGVLTLCSVLTLGTGIALDYQLSRDEVLQRLQIEARDTIDAALADLEHLLSGVEAATRMLGRVVARRDYSRDDLSHLAQELVEGNPNIYGATIALNPEATIGGQGFSQHFYRRMGILTQVDLAAAQSPYTEQRWYNDVAQSGTASWIEPYLDRHGGETLMTTFSAPVHHIDDEGVRSLYAVVTADIALDELHNYLQRLQLGEHGNSLLFSREGLVLSSRNEHTIMRHYSELVPHPEHIAQWRSLFAASLAGASQTTSLPCPTKPDDCTLLLSPLQSTGWPVGILYNEAELLAPLRAFSVKSAIIGFSSLALMIIAVTLVTRRVTRPLEALALASGHIARGELYTPLPRLSGNDEVAQLVQAFKAMKHDLKSYISELEDATARRGRVEGELAAAREIQMAMLPGGGELNVRELTHTLWATVLPARAVGGDLYSYRLTAATLDFAIGDVSDKGVPAALFMARAISLLQQLPVSASPGDNLASLNNTLTENNDNCMFVTLLLAQLDLASGELVYASAGHPAPLLQRDGRIDELPLLAGPAAGLARGLEFATSTCQLAPGDRLALYTDGIDEAFNDAGEMFSLDRLKAILNNGAFTAGRAAGKALLDEIKTFSAGVAQSDDIALMVLTLPAGTASNQLASAEFELGRQPVSSALAWLQQRLQPLNLGAEWAGELALVTEEMVANVAEHAGLDDRDKVSVSVATHAAGITIEVRDGGAAFNPLQQSLATTLGADTEAAKIGGLGMRLIMQLSDEQHYHREDGQNILGVTRYFHRGPANS